MGGCYLILSSKIYHINQKIEGGVGPETGRGKSIWDTFSHSPNRTLNGDTGDIACDHYNKYKEDVKLMKDLGIK